MTKNFLKNKKASTDLTMGKLIILILVVIVVIMVFVLLTRFGFLDSFRNLFPSFNQTIEPPEPNELDWPSREECLIRVGKFDFSSNKINFCSDGDCEKTVYTGIYLENSNVYFQSLRNKKIEIGEVVSAENSLILMNKDFYNPFSEVYRSYYSKGLHARDPNFVKFVVLEKPENLRISELIFNWLVELDNSFILSKSGFICRNSNQGLIKEDYEFGFVLNPISQEIFDESGTLATIESDSNDFYSVKDLNNKRLGTLRVLKNNYEHSFVINQDFFRKSSNIEGTFKMVLRGINLYRVPDFDKESKEGFETN